MLRRVPLSDPNSGVFEMPKRAGRGISLAFVSSRYAAPLEMIPAIAMQSWPTNTNMMISTVYGKDVDAGRTESVKKALEHGMKYVWFIDDDTVPPVDAGRSLLYLLEQNGPALGGKVMVAGGIYTTRSSPPEPIVYMEQGAGSYWGWKCGETFKCWGIGTGCMMINLEVFEHLEEPWFQTTMEAEKKETDDLFFCQKVSAAGFEIMAHGGILCHHYDMQYGAVYMLPRASAPYVNRISEPREPRTPTV